jgi:hypothetical protein
MALSSTLILQKEDFMIFRSHSRFGIDPAEAPSEAISEMVPGKISEIWFV